jgi:putative phosphoesterase
MKICIVSDSHDNRSFLETAVREAVAAGAEMVLHCGDVVAPSTLEVIKPFGIPIHVIHGNNTGDLFMMSRIASKAANNVTFHGQDAGIKLCGKRVFLVHYPHYAKAMATTGDWDLVCCGHDHKASINSIENMSGNKTVIVNPGTVGGIMAPATWVFGDLESMTFTINELDTAVISHTKTA